MYHTKDSKSREKCNSNPQHFEHYPIHAKQKFCKQLASTRLSRTRFLSKLSVQLASCRVSHIAREGSHDARRSPDDRIAGDLLADPVVHLTAFLHELWTCINPFNQAPTIVL